MRRRSPTSFSSEQMEKGTGKNQHTRIYLLTSLSVFFWMLLLYFHFSVIGTSTISTPALVGPQTSQLEAAHSDSQPLVITNSITNPSPKINATVESIPVKSEAVEAEKYPFMRALRSAENESDPCGGTYIYVHNLPPRFNVDMLKQCRTLSLWTNMCKFTTKAGLDPPLENVEGVFEDTGWYATNQFAVDVIFANRMKQYKCLTSDSVLQRPCLCRFMRGLILRGTFGGLTYRGGMRLHWIWWIGL